MKICLQINLGLLISYESICVINSINLKCDIIRFLSIYLTFISQKLSFWSKMADFMDTEVTTWSVLVRWINWKKLKILFINYHEYIKSNQVYTIIYTYTIIILQFNLGCHTSIYKFCKVLLGHVWPCVENITTYKWVDEVWPDGRRNDIETGCGYMHVMMK